LRLNLPAGEAKAGMQAWWGAMTRDKVFGAWE